MLTEHAELHVRAGQEAAFAAMMMAEARPLLLALPGVLSVRLGRGVEHPQKFMLIIEWAEMAAHDAFGGTDAQSRFRALLSPYVTGGAMEHFEIDP
jgi:quinol monooxygenase YgiN